MGWISDFLGRFRKRGPEDPKASIQKGKCPDCGNGQFWEGPSGGICTNFCCTNCHSAFNVGIACGEVICADRISNEYWICKGCDQRTDTCKCDG